LPAVLFKSSLLTRAEVESDSALWPTEFSDPSDMGDGHEGVLRKSAASEQKKPRCEFRARFFLDRQRFQPWQWQLFSQQPSPDLCSLAQASLQ
jgi:hypothetical protein